MEKKLQGILNKFMLETLLFYKWFGFLNEQRKYIRHYMLAFPLLWSITSTYSHKSMKDKYQRSYFSPVISVN